MWLFTLDDMNDVVDETRKSRHEGTRHIEDPYKQCDEQRRAKYTAESKRNATEEVHLVDSKPTPIHVIEEVFE